VFTFPFFGYSQGNALRPITLTVKHVVFDIQTNSITSLILSDEQGNTIDAANKKIFEFENAEIVKIFTPEGTKLSSEKLNDNFVIVVSEGSKVIFEFKVNNKIYPIGVGAGSKFLVRKTSETKYILLAEETAKLSPPPTQ
jgi:hypothetical protein